MIQLLYLFHFCGGGGNDMYIHLWEPVYLDVYIKPIKITKCKKKKPSPEGLYTW